MELTTNKWEHSFYRRVFIGFFPPDFVLFLFLLLVYFLSFIPCVYTLPLSPQHERQHILRVSMTCIFVQPWLSLTCLSCSQTGGIFWYPSCLFLIPLPSLSTQRCYRQQVTRWNRKHCAVMVKLKTRSSILCFQRGVEESYSTIILS